MQKEDTKKYDVAIIGAGPAGIMAAITSAELGLSVVLVEKNKSLAKKLLLSGGGRCNLTNAEFNLRDLAKKYHNGEFLFHAFSEFCPKDTIEFFEKLGVKTKTEKNKKVFPVSNEAEEVLEALEKKLEKTNVEVIFNSEIVDIEKKGTKITKLILKNGQVVAKKYILATGGKSYPATGSNGIGYKLAEKLGHTIIKPIPALSPIIAKEEWVKGLQGISLKDVKISVLGVKKPISEEGEIVFTHLGISGPAVLDISSEVAELLENGKTKIALDLFPLLNQEELQKGFEDVLKQHANKSAKNILASFVPEKMAEILLDVTELDKNKIANNMSKIERQKIVSTLKKIEITVEDISGFDLAKVTRGGISLKEIDHKTMQSKIIDNLAFAGEIIDVDGKTGGFNLQMCWSTGFLAGKNSK
jgi:predicted Rossmann fold flavoprotein